MVSGNLRQLITGKGQAAEGAAEGDDPVVVNPMAGMISVKATQVQQPQIQAYVDQVSPNAKRQVLIEVTVVEVNLSDQYQAGVDWARVSVRRRARQGRRVVRQRPHRRQPGRCRRSSA